MIRLILFIILMVLTIVSNFHQNRKLPQKCHIIEENAVNAVSSWLNIFRESSLVLTPKIEYCTAYKKFFFYFPQNSNTVHTFFFKSQVISSSLYSHALCQPSHWHSMHPLSVLLGKSLWCNYLCPFLFLFCTAHSVKKPLASITSKHLSLPFRYCFYQQAVSSVNHNKSEGRLQQRER